MAIKVNSPKIKRDPATLNTGDAWIDIDVNADKIKDDKDKYVYIIEMKLEIREYQGIDGNITSSLKLYTFYPPKGKYKVSTMTKKIRFNSFDPKMSKKYECILFVKYENIEYEIIDICDFIYDYEKNPNVPD